MDQDVKEILDRLTDVSSSLAAVAAAQHNKIAGMSGDVAGLLETTKELSRAVAVGRQEWVEIRRSIDDLTHAIAARDEWFARHERAHALLDQKIAALVEIHAEADRKVNALADIVASHDHKLELLIEAMKLDREQDAGQDRRLADVDRRLAESAAEFRENLARLEAHLAVVVQMMDDWIRNNPRREGPQ